MLRYFLIIIPIICLFPKCTVRNSNSNLSDTPGVDTNFTFLIESSNDYIDSKKGTLSRRFTYGYRIATFTLTADELDKIKKLYFKLQLDTLANNFDPNCQTCMEPFFEQRFFISYKGIQKRFIHIPEYCCTDKYIDNIVNNMDSLSSTILNIIYSKKEPKMLDPSDIIYF